MFCVFPVDSMHVTGEQLGHLTGIAAVLRFPLPEIEDDDDSDEVGTVCRVSFVVLACSVVYTSACSDYGSKVLTDPCMPSSTQ